MTQPEPNLTAIAVSQGRIEQKLDQLVANDDDKEKRLRVVERWQAKVTPFYAAGTMLLGVAAGLLMRKLF